MCQIRLQFPTFYCMIFHAALGAWLSWESNRRSVRPPDKTPKQHFELEEYGALAQLVARCVRNAEVRGSNPLRSTTICLKSPIFIGLFCTSEVF